MYKNGVSIYKLCPFFLVYKYDEDEEEYGLDSYDEMHNHVLNFESSRIMPLPKTNIVKPIYETPLFFRFNSIIASNFDQFIHQVVQLGKERAFDLIY